MDKCFNWEPYDNPSPIEYAIEKDPNRFLTFPPNPEPKGFKGKAAGKGEMILTCDDNMYVRGYQFEYRSLNSNNWKAKTVLRPKHKIILTGLESGQEYIFRVIFIGDWKIRWKYSAEIRSFILPLSVM